MPRARITGRRTFDRPEPLGSDEPRRHMGTFRVEIEVGDPTGGRFERIDALVDTGATYTSLPHPPLHALRVTPPSPDSFLPADGRRGQQAISPTSILIGGQGAI